MARKKCPGCGGWYNGRKCPQCLYVPFEFDDAGYRPSHTYGNTAAPARNTQSPSFQPRRQNANPWQQKKNTRPGAKFASSIVAVLVVMVLTSFINVVITAIEDLSASVSYAEPEPERIDLPQGGLVLYEDGRILVMADWEDGTPITGDLRILVQNDMGRDLAVQASAAAVNGLMTDSVFFYCDAYAGTISEGTLWVSPEELAEFGIDEISRIELRIEIYDAETYETVAYTDVIRLDTGLPDSGIFLDSAGTVVHDGNGVRLIYHGSQVSDYGTYLFRFYVENNTDRHICLSSTEVSADGTPVDTFLWQELLPGTRAICHIEVYDPEGLGFDDISDIQALEFALLCENAGDWAPIFEAGLLTVDVAAAS